MSILKGILHHWNKTNSAYDTIHPETEVAQVTDWNKGIVNTLANTGLSSLVNVLSSDSLLALLIKKVFDATGVKYSLGENGYVCFGSLVGGLIIQWGIIDALNNAVFTFPLAFNMVFAIIGNKLSNDDEWITTAFKVKSYDSKSCVLYSNGTGKAIIVAIGS